MSANEETIDQRGIPTHECFNCGSNMFEVIAIFENYNISSWLLDGKCAECGSQITVPCPADRPKELPGDDHDH